jgi:hypothetical protein
MHPAGLLNSSRQCIGMPAECREFFGRSLFFVGEFGFKVLHCNLQVKKTTHR